MSFKTLASENASLISLNNSAFIGWLKLKPSTQRGNLIAIFYAGNSYKILENIVLMSFILKFAQFIGITLVLYLSVNF